MDEDILRHKEVKEELDYLFKQCDGCNFLKYEKETNVYLCKSKNGCVRNNKNLEEVEIIERSNSLTAFDKIMPIRFSSTQIRDINFIVEKKKDKFESVSHFVRSAVIRLIRDEK